MGISKTGYVLSVFLASSAALGGAILARDDVLWKYAPSHAYGLVGFTILNLAFVGLLFFKSRKALLFAGAWGLIQLILLIGNVFIGAQFGVTGFTQEELTAYFLGGAISHKGSTIPPTFGFYKISPYAYDILLSLQALIAIIGLVGYRRIARVPYAA